ncbi:MAG: AI-2E family transporter, partial [Clostridia bacterium]|nr:AI-2E family transporter [Clostridia bacterium]
MKDIKSNKKAMAAIFVGAVCILLFLAVQNLDVIAKAIGWLSDLFLPLTVGFCLAMIIDLPMQFFERKLLKKCTKAWAAKLRKPLALVVSLAIVISVIVGITMLIIPQLSEAVRVVFSSVNELKNLIAETDGRLLEKLPFGDMLMRTDREKLIDTILEYMGGNSDYLLDTAIDTISLVVNLAIDGFASVILAIYIIFEKKKFKKDAKRLIYAWLPEKAASWIIHAVHISVDISRNFIVGQTIEAIILGSLCGIGMF